MELEPRAVREPQDAHPHAVRAHVESVDDARHEALHRRVLVAVVGDAARVIDEEDEVEAAAVAVQACGRSGAGEAQATAGHRDGSHVAVSHREYTSRPLSPPITSPSSSLVARPHSPVLTPPRPHFTPLPRPSGLTRVHVSATLSLRHFPSLLRPRPSGLTRVHVTATLPVRHTDLVYRDVALNVFAAMCDESDLCEA